MSKNITLAVDETVLEKARIAAAKRHTTVNAAVRIFLEKFGSEDDRIAVSRKRLKSLMDKTDARLGPGYRWNREDLYDD